MPRTLLRGVPSTLELGVPYMRGELMSASLGFPMTIKMGDKLMKIKRVSCLRGEKTHLNNWGVGWRTGRRPGPLPGSAGLWPGRWASASGPRWRSPGLSSSGRGETWAPRCWLRTHTHTRTTVAFVSHLPQSSQDGSEHRNSRVPGLAFRPRLRPGVDAGEDIVAAGVYKEKQQNPNLSKTIPHKL